MKQHHKYASIAALSALGMTGCTVALILTSGKPDVWNTLLTVVVYVIFLVGFHTSLCFYNQCERDHNDDCCSAALDNMAYLFNLRRKWFGLESDRHFRRRIETASGIRK